MADACGYRALRDRGLLLFGFASAMRRSELVALDRDHVAWVYEPSADHDARRGMLNGVVVTIPRSKTDQQHKGTTIAVPARPDRPYFPVQALQD